MNAHARYPKHELKHKNHPSERCPLERWNAKVFCPVRAQVDYEERMKAYDDYGLGSRYENEGLNVI